MPSRADPGDPTKVLVHEKLLKMMIMSTRSVPIGDMGKVPRPQLFLNVPMKRHFVDAGYCIRQFPALNAEKIRDF